MNARSSRIVIGTRGSRLALAQTTLMVELLQAHHPQVDFEVRVVRTEGDRVQDRPVSQIGDKGIFTRAIEQELLAGTIDFAVHSLKDIPSDDVNPGLELAAYSQRVDPRDVLVSRSGRSLQDLPARARVGTGSLRRRMQLQELRPDLTVVGIRGNVDTRVRRLDDGEYDALVLAAAGLERLELQNLATEYLAPDQFIPDAGQGIIALQARKGEGTARLAQAIDCSDSRLAAETERAVVRALSAGCRSPVGAHAVVTGERVRLNAFAATEDGTVIRRAAEEVPRKEAPEAGYRIGTHLARLLAHQDEPA